MNTASATSMPTIAATNAPGSSSNDNTTGVIVGVLIALLFVFLLSFIGICAVVVLRKRKRQKFEISTGMFIKI